MMLPQAGMTYRDDSAGDCQPEPAASMERGAGAAAFLTEVAAQRFTGTRLKLTQWQSTCPPLFQVC